MISRRTIINLIAFFAAAALLVYLGLTTLVLGKSGGAQIGFEFTDAAGLAPRDDVTMRGVPVGQVQSVTLMDDGLAKVVVLLDPGTDVPKGTHASINRRSPIGDLVLDMTPGHGPTLRSGSTIGVKYTLPPPDPERTIQDLAVVLRAVPSKDLSSLIDTLAQAIQGRTRDLQTLEVAGGDLPQRILRVRQDLTSLIETSPDVLGVLAQNSQTLADDVTQTKDLAGILDHERHTLVNLSKNGASLADVANEIIATEKPNIACLLNDLATVNSTLAEPGNLQNLDTTLDLNHYFFDGVRKAVVTGLDGLNWFRVDLLPAQMPLGRAYHPKRNAADVFPGNSCQPTYGKGVGPVTQPGPAYLAPGSHVHPGH